MIPAIASRCRFDIESVFLLTSGRRTSIGRHSLGAKSQPRTGGQNHWREDAVSKGSDAVLGDFQLGQGFVAERLFAQPPAWTAAGVAARYF